MPKFEIGVSRTFYYYVEAEDADEAQDLLFSGDLDFEEHDSSVDDVRVWEVEDDDE